MATSKTTASKAPAAAPKNSDAAKAAKAEKFTYEVVSPLDHDQVRYEVGESVELTVEQAEPLLGHTVKAPVADAE